MGDEGQQLTMAQLLAQNPELLQAMQVCCVRCQTHVVHFWSVKKLTSYFLFDRYDRVIKEFETVY